MKDSVLIAGVTFFEVSSVDCEFGVVVLFECFFVAFYSGFISQLVNQGIGFEGLGMFIFVLYF